MLSKSLEKFSSFVSNDKIKRACEHIFKKHIVKCSPYTIDTPFCTSTFRFETNKDPRSCCQTSCTSPEFHIPKGPTNNINQQKSQLFQLSTKKNTFPSHKSTPILNPDEFFQPELENITPFGKEKEHPEPNPSNFGVPNVSFLRKSGNHHLSNQPTNQPPGRLGIVSHFRPRGSPDGHR